LNSSWPGEASPSEHAFVALGIYFQDFIDPSLRFRILPVIQYISANFTREGIFLESISIPFLNFPELSLFAPEQVKLPT